MEAYGLSNNSPLTGLKQRVQVDDISVGDIEFEYLVNSTTLTKEFTMPVPVLHGAPVECDVGTEWYAVDELEPISSHIGNSAFRWKPIFQWIGTLMPYYLRQYISLRLTLSILTLDIHM